MPASGKSRYASRLEGELLRNGIRVEALPLRLGSVSRLRRVIWKLKLIAPFALRNAALVYGAYHFVANSRPVSRYHFIRVYGNWLYVFAVIQRAVRRDAIALLDQGLTQAVWSTAYCAGEEVENLDWSFIERVCTALDVSDLVVVHLEAGADVIRDRLARRKDNRSPLDGKRGGSMGYALEVTDRIARQVSGLSGRHAWLHVIEGREVSENCKFIRRII